MNIVFDFGAVLFTWQPADLLRTRFPEWVDAAGNAPALAQAIFHHEDWQAFDRGTSEQDHVVARTAERLALPHDDLHGLVSGIAQRLEPMQGTIDLLKGLVQRRESQQDVRLYFLSNMPAPYARILEDLHDFIEDFDGGIFSGDVSHIKPEPAIYQLLQDRYSLAPERTVFVDDLKANIDAARAQGWHAIHFQSPEQLKQELAALGL
ncbi:MAG: hypothetical protein RJA34_1189 [Pseudomonadota bacterium]|jgi:putative hydrolase of the HAD superfamily